MKISDLLKVIYNSKLIIESEITIYGYSRRVTVFEGNCENVIKHGSSELLEAEVIGITFSAIGLIIRVSSQGG